MNTAEKLAEERYPEDPSMSGEDFYWMQQIRLGFISGYNAKPSLQWRQVINLDDLPHAGWKGTAKFVNEFGSTFTDDHANYNQLLNSFRTRKTYYISHQEDVKEVAVQFLKYWESLGDDKQALSYDHAYEWFITNIYNKN